MSFQPPPPPGSPLPPPTPPAPGRGPAGSGEPERRAFFTRSAKGAARGALQAAEFLPPVARVFRMLGVEPEKAPPKASGRTGTGASGGLSPNGGPAGGTPASAAAGAVRRWPVLTLPPGAVANFYTTCTRCNDCVAACPHWSIRKAGLEFGPALEGFPLLLPSETACHLCTDLPCIAACEPHALMPLPIAAIRLGAVAVIDYATCSVPQGKACDVCIKACPVAAQAIFADSRGVPQVIATGCTGCGLCVAPCPTGAVRMEAARG
ncbi:MAG TPA: 4Fe-4S dicluster-binding protein [Planctomycetota bacterium]|nr:4Fe-4S dicluster-binding protein [Planctomycetota bacterium]